MNWNGFTVLSSLHRPELNQFPNIALPFYVRSTGHFRRAHGSLEAVPPGEKPFVQFYWCIARRDGVCSRLVSLQNPQG